MSGDRQRIRRSLLRRDGDLCAICKDPLNGDHSIDHILARCNGGSNRMDNLQLVHHECNCRKNHNSDQRELNMGRNKFDHVRHAKQTRNHTCHWPWCGKQVKPAMWGCSEHWFSLPIRLRNRIWSTYRAGQEETMTPSIAYLEVAHQVERWIEIQVLL